MWVQLRTGFRQQHTYVIPDVAQPGCRAGMVSTRHWLDWRQANSVIVFGIEFMREVARVLAEGGTTPADAWIEQSWHTRAGSPTRHQSVMDPYGEANCAALVNKLTYPVNSLTFHQLLNDVVPQVLKTLPMDLSKTVGKPGEHIIAPYMWTIDLKKPQIPSTFKYRDNLREIVFTSPHYYCGYTAASTGPASFSSRSWPLNPADERLPIVYDANPASLPKRSDVPAQADRIVDTIRNWGHTLGFTVGPTETGSWNAPTGGKSVKYIVDAPVNVDVSLVEFLQRAQKLADIVHPLISEQAAREKPEKYGYDHVRFSTPPGFFAKFTAPDKNGQPRLRVETRIYE